MKYSNVRSAKLDEKADYYGYDKPKNISSKSTPIKDLEPSPVMERKSPEPEKSDQQKIQAEVQVIIKQVKEAKNTDELYDLRGKFQDYSDDSGRTAIMEAIDQRIKELGAHPSAELASGTYTIGGNTFVFTAGDLSRFNDLTINRYPHRFYVISGVINYKTVDAFVKFEGSRYYNDLVKSFNNKDKVPINEKQEPTQQQVNQQQVNQQSIIQRDDSTTHQALSLAGQAGNVITQTQNRVEDISHILGSKFPEQFNMLTQYGPLLLAGTGFALAVFVWNQRAKPSQQSTEEEE